MHNELKLKKKKKKKIFDLSTTERWKA